jgi:hypothetical protein
MQDSAILSTPICSSKLTWPASDVQGDLKSVAE